MKNFLILILIVFIFQLGKAQSNIRINNYWENTYYINPASLNDDYRTVFTTSARKQWIRFPGAPNTLFATAVSNLDRMHTQFGMKAFVDKIGFTSTSNFALSYAYTVTLNKNILMNLGINANVQSLSYDFSQSNLEIIGDPAIYRNLEKRNNYNSDLGVEFAYKTLILGASAQNLFSMFNRKDPLQSNTNIFYGTYREYRSQLVNMGFGASLIENLGVYQAELTASTYFRITTDPNFLQVGIFYRTRKEMGAIVGIDISNSMHLSYSYDFNVGGISRSSIGTQELMLIFKFHKYPDCRPCRMYGDHYARKNRD
jgi:type IX secretion system PorP/SprF family membrane protein